MDHSLFSTVGAERVPEGGQHHIYPLPPGMKPVEQKPLEMAPEVVTQKGLVYAGVHRFGSRFVWAPDSHKVGLIDCLFDYRLRDDAPEAFEKHGKPENERCFAVAVGLNGVVQKTPLPVASSKDTVLVWTDAHTLRVTDAGRVVQVRVQ
jgi:hypothetical protein